MWDAGVVAVVVAVVGTAEVVEASAVVEMAAVAGIVVGSETVAVALSEAEVAVGIVVGLEVAGTAAGDEAAVAASGRAAEVVETVVGAEVVASVVEPVLETGMAGLASSLGDADWAQVAKVVTFDWMEFAVGTSEVICPGQEAEVVTQDVALWDPGTAVEGQNLVEDLTGLEATDGHQFVAVMWQDVVASFGEVDQVAAVVYSLVVIQA